jgi:hypothetical protein
MEHSRQRPLITITSHNGQVVAPENGVRISMFQHAMFILKTD